jgi:hypothetical protein
MKKIASGMELILEPLFCLPHAKPYIVTSFIIISGLYFCRRHSLQSKKKENRKMKEESTKDEVDEKPAGKKTPPLLEFATAVQSSEDMESTPVTPKDRKKARKMRRKKRQIVSSRQDPHKINQAFAPRRSRLPPSQQREDDSSSVATGSESSARPGAVREGGTESNHDELTLQTQEEPGTEQGFETIIIPIAAEVVLPDNGPDNTQAISEAQIVETAKICGQPRWLVFALLGVLVVGVIGVGLGVAFGNGGADDDPPSSVPRGIELEKKISAIIPSLQLGPSQTEALNWLADDDPANLDFELVSTDELLERFIMALLYFSMGGDNWANSFGFLSASSVCMWEEYSPFVYGGVRCDPMVFEITLWSNNLQGQLPTELGLLSNLRFLSLGYNQIFGLFPTELGRLTSLEGFFVCKFATSTELGTRTLFESVLQCRISSTVL